MALNDREIKEMVKNGSLIAENYNDDSLTPNGYDIRIGKISTEEISTNTLFFVSSLEVIKLPGNIVATLHIKSRYARRGIFSSFGFVDAGFHGELTMAFYNFGDAIVIKPHAKFVQIVFDRISMPEKDYGNRSGNYMDSTGIDLR
ncbi:MAG: dCTP deaminase [Ferroplasma sp.]